MDLFYIDYNLGKIAVHQTQTDAGTILFIHGNSLSSYSFSKQLNSGLADKYHLVAMDLPGHGDSSWYNNPDNDYSIKSLAGAIKKVISEINCKNLIIVAHSLGGHLLLEMCNEINSLKGLMIFGTPPMPANPDMSAMYNPIEAAGLFFKADLTEDEIEALCTNIVLDKSLVDDNFINQVRKTHPQFRSACFKAIVSGEITDEAGTVEKLKIPILIAHGEKDSGIRLDYIEKLNIPALWNSRVQIIKDSGHCPQFEKPNEFNKLLEEFAVEVFK